MQKESTQTAQKLKYVIQTLYCLTYYQVIKFKFLKNKLFMLTLKCFP